MVVVNQTRNGSSSVEDDGWRPRGWKARKPYVPPELRSLGTVAKLTGVPASGEARRKPHG
jgi:hypothetical protein